MFSLSRGEAFPFAGIFRIPTYIRELNIPRQNVERDNVVNWYWKQYTEERPYESGWMRPYEGDPMGFCDKRGMIAWGHYIPVHQANDDPDPNRRAFFDRLKKEFRWDRRPMFASLKALVNVNQHLGWVDARRDKIKGYYHYFGTPQIDWRSTWKMQTPPHLLQDNWKPITLSEEIAHKERMEIAGRNRRYYYKLKYHPINGKFFQDKTSDAQWVKYARVRHEMTSVWGEDQHTRGGVNWYTKYYVIPLLIIAYMWYDERNHPDNAKYRSYVGHNPSIMYEYNMKRPQSFIHRLIGAEPSQEPVKNFDDWLFGNGLAGLLWPLTYWMDDQSDSSREQWDSYKRCTSGVTNTPREVINVPGYRADPITYAEYKTGGVDPVPPIERYSEK